MRLTNGCEINNHQVSRLIGLLRRMPVDITIQPHPSKEDQWLVLDILHHDAIIHSYEMDDLGMMREVTIGDWE